MTITLLEGDARAVLATLPAACVRCCVTSPPYLGLRDYGHADQIGLEATPEAYVAALVGVFREVRRVLADDGTLWLNLGDSYAGSWGNQGRKAERGTQRPIHGEMIQPVLDGRYPSEGSGTGSLARTPGLKNKDLIGIPWRVAFALQADGWYLRQDIIWAKPNPMPESVRDRCTKAHEYVFLLSKSARYYFDAEAISEPAATFGRQGRSDSIQPKHAALAATGAGRNPGLSDHFNRENRHRHSVWTIATHPYTDAHFAMMPLALARDCILAGSAPGDTVLDPFAGAGTTGLVADRLQREAVLVELNPDYVALARARIVRDAPLFVEVA